MSSNSNPARPVEFACLVNPNNTSWLEFRRICETVEALGFDYIWVPDLLSPSDADWSDGPVLECWSLLGAVASFTHDIRIGPLVCANTYRHPVMLAKIATTVEIMSDGRLTYGIGAAWSTEEHRSYGIPFDSIGKRVAQMEEAIQLTKLLWQSPDPVDFHGCYYTLDNAPFNPKPVQKPHPPVMVAGGGEKLTLRAVARHADEMNVYGSPEVVAHKLDVLRQHCLDEGRDFDEIKKTVLVHFVPPERQKTWDEFLANRAVEQPVLLSRGQGHAMTGDADDWREWVQARVDVGVDQIILGLYSPYVFNGLTRFAKEVIPRFR